MYEISINAHERDSRRDNILVYVYGRMYVYRLIEIDENGMRKGDCVTGRSQSLQCGTLAPK